MTKAITVRLDEADHAALEAQARRIGVRPGTHERQPAVLARMERWQDDGEALHAPAVLPYELADVLARVVYDGDLEANEVPARWEDLDALGLVLHPLELTRDGAAVAEITALLRRRHATDSAYVSLAQRLRTSMWTLDAALARNAAAVGLPVTLLA